MRCKLSFFILVFIIISSIGIIAQLTGEAITGKAIAQKTNLSIVVDVDSPSLIIFSPQNITYNINSLPINYSAYDIYSSLSKVWYSLDNSANITLTGNITINVLDGSHTITLYANDSFNYLNSSSVAFSIDSSLGWNVSSFKYNGTTTNFTDLIYKGKTYMNNISNFTLEITKYGKIVFNEPINISRDIFLDDYSDISVNSICIYPNQIQELNKSATLFLYNLTYTNPRILKDNEVCPSSICTKESYINRTLKFNVTHFSCYSAEETPTEPPQQPPAEGGGGGGAAAIKDFSLDKQNIKVKLKQGETKKETMTIKNTGNQKIIISIFVPTLEDFLKISERSFELEAGNTKVITLDFIAREDAKPELYMGKLIVKSDRIEKEVLVAVEVESKKPLFDVKLEIPKNYQTVLPGEEIYVNVKIYNLGKEGRVDIKAEYTIRDESNNIIISDEETLAIETQASFVKMFQLPLDIKYGTYIFYIKTTYNGEVASASAWFTVGRKLLSNTEKIWLLIAGIIGIILIFIVYELRIMKKYMKTYMKIDEKVLVKEKLIKLREEEKTEL